ncbi:hypothetical protein KSP39_PZI010083 [Platanthera zijinensis]|uniref:Uncharacterized protein n=1 Tax=Platanthera zijinensis TaxID=2320716 RepID=A0AAP0G6M5_9ASPA
MKTEEDFFPRSVFFLQRRLKPCPTEAPSPPDPPSSVTPPTPESLLGAGDCSCYSRRLLRRVHTPSTPPGCTSPSKSLPGAPSAADRDVGATPYSRRPRLHSLRRIFLRQELPVLAELSFLPCSRPAKCLPSSKTSCSSSGPV